MERQSRRRTLPGHLRGGSLVLYAGALPAYRVLMMWVYDRTGSLLVAMLMHAGLSASTLILRPVTTGMPHLTWKVVLAAALWIAVASVAMIGGGRISRRGLPKAVA